MNPSIILSLVGILISIYTIANPSKKRNLKFKFSVFSYIIFFTMIILFFMLLILVGYYNMFDNKDVFSIFNIKFNLTFWYSLLNLFTLALISIYFSYILFNNLIKRKIEFLKNLRIYFNNDQVDIIIEDLNIYFKKLMNKYYIPSGRKIEKNELYMILSGSELSKFKLFRNRIFNILNYKNIKFSLEINSLFSDLLKNNLFIKKIIVESPYLGTKIINSNLKKNLKMEFVNKFLKKLLLHEGSIIFTQIKNNKNLRDRTRYEILPENYLLFCLFKDIKVAYELEIWRPIGEGTIQYLEKQNNKDNDLGNDTNIEFEEKPFFSPVFVGIIFFDIMVHEAMAKNIEWHMWLYYYNFFTKNIAKNIAYDESSGEFANMYEYYLYVIFDNYKKWIEYTFETDIEYNIDLDEINYDHQNNNIIKSSIISMSQSMDNIAKSSIRKSYKIYLFNIVLRSYFYLVLNTDTKANDYGQVLKLCIIDKIRNFRDTNTEFKDLMIDALDKYDKPKLIDTQDGMEKFEELKTEIMRL